MASKRSASTSEQPSARKSKRMCSFSSWQSEEFEVEYNGQTKTYLGSVLSGKDGDEKAYCKQCRTSFSVAHGGAYDVRRHFKSAGHNKAVESTKKTRLEAFGFGESRVAKAARDKQEEQKMQVLSAEAQFVQFIAEHNNMSFRSGVHFTKLVKSMFPDSDINCQAVPVLKDQDNGLGKNGKQKVLSG